MAAEPLATSRPPPDTLSPPLPPPPFTTAAFSNFHHLLTENRPKVRVTTEYDSDSSVFFNKISCKVLDSIAKLKLTFQNNGKGEISESQLSLTSKNVSLFYDVDEQEAALKTNFDVAPGLNVNSAHNFKTQQGVIAMVADLAGPDYKLQLSTNVPSIGVPRATLKFPLGEVSLEERDTEEEETKKVLSINGFLKGQLLSGACTAIYDEETLNLRYSYKDEQLTFIPSISLPSNAVSVAFKRRFGPSDKLTYGYNFDNDTWSAVYKHTVGKDYKLKAGYDSDVRLGWASFWIGDETGKAKTAPLKTKVQFMLQVPQDNVQSPALMFRVKKRWDI